MKVAQRIADARAAIAQWRRTGLQIGCVPTMGALHDGHWSLIEQCVAETDACVVTVFVNPLQFGPEEDFERYPRAWDDDLAGCAERGVRLVFHPGAEEMYERGECTRVHVAGLSETLCGKYRPGHFDGVCTVVCKLFNIVEPDVAYFGEKDYQQLVVIRRIVEDLNMPVSVVGLPTIREPDGLAMSSRNDYLTTEARRQACVMHASLAAAAGRVAAGERDARSIEREIHANLEKGGAESIDYVSVVDPDTLQAVETIAGPARICLAAWFGGARLIDNVAVDGSGGAG